jgi:hypothetical protein
MEISAAARVGVVVCVIGVAGFRLTGIIIMWRYYGSR